MDDIKQTNNDENSAKSLLVSAGAVEIERRIRNKPVSPSAAIAGRRLGIAFSGIFWLGVLVIPIAVVILLIRHFL